MAFHSGAGARFAIGKESAWGTPVADTMLVNFGSESLAPEVTKTEEESVLAALAAAGYDLQTLKVSGDVAFILKPENAGFVMKAALGGTDTLVLVTGQQQHTIAPAAAAGSMPSYTVLIDRKQVIKQYSGVKVDSLKLEAKAGDYVRATLTLKGKDEAVVASIATLVPPSLKAYKFVGATVVAGGVSLEVTGITFDYANQLEDGPQTSGTGVYLSEPIHGKRKASVTLELPYGSAAEAIQVTNLLTDTVLSSVVLHFESPALIATTYKYRMDITLNNVAVLGCKTNVGDTGVLMTTINGEATEVGATAPISVVVYDATAVAY